MAQKALANLEAAGIARPVNPSGKAQKILDTLETGYFSEKAVAGREELGLDPYLTTERAAWRRCAGNAVWSA